MTSKSSFSAEGVSSVGTHPKSKPSLAKSCVEEQGKAPDHLVYPAVSHVNDRKALASSNYKGEKVLDEDSCINSYPSYVYSSLPTSLSSVFPTGTQKFYTTSVMTSSASLPYAYNTVKDSNKIQSTYLSGGEENPYYYTHKNFGPQHQRTTSFSHTGVPLSIASSIMAQKNIILDESVCSAIDYNGIYDTEEKSAILSVNDLSAGEVAHVPSGYAAGGQDIVGGGIVGDIQVYRASSRTHREKYLVGDNQLRLALIGMLSMSVLCNYDHGAIPATLGDIQKDFPMGYIEQSLLGSLVYFGLIIGTLLAGLAFQQFRAKWLIVCSLGSLSFSLYLFSASANLVVMYITRFLSGLCQAMPIVYLPVWVDDFAPDGSVTRWMSYTQLASIGGTVCGYFFGGVLSHWKESTYSEGIYSATQTSKTYSSWRTPFLIQSMLLVPTICLLSLLPSHVLNIAPPFTIPQQSSSETDNQKRGDKLLIDRSSSSLNGNLFYKRERVWNENKDSTFWSILKTTCKETKNLLRNPLYVLITLAMSNLYFVVTGIQFWVTEYMTVVLHHAKLTVVSLSTFCFLTAPTSGVWFGGYICDMFGGYRGQHKNACRVATIFAALAAQFACLTTQLCNVFLFTLVLWGCLFFGAALVPVAVGVVLSCVPPYQRSLSSAASQFAYNMFGWFSAPLLSGIVMDIIALKRNIAPELPLKIGFSMILMMSLIGFFLFAIANFVASSEEEVGQEELEMQLARSRLPTLSF